MSKVAIAGIVVGVLGAFVLLGFGLYYGGIGANKVQANYNKRVVTSRVQKDVRQPGFARTVYERFFELCAGVQTSEASLEQQYAQLDTADTPEDRTRIRINIGGLVATRADAANTYNAAAAEYTRGQFLADSLPATISATYTKGDHTRCAA